MLDWVLANASLIDVAAEKVIETDIGIQGATIAKIGNNLGPRRKTYDAKGRHVSPGFIDIHMHEEDLRLSGLRHPDISLALLKGGVTTAVGGNCGAVRNDFYEFINYVKNGNYPINFMTYIGHNYLRAEVGSVDIYKKSTRLQISQMVERAQKAVDAGAVGVSYGFEYAPGVDLDEACSLIAPFKGRSDLLLAFHARYDAKKAIQALQEIRDIALFAEIPVQVSHLSSLSAYGQMSESVSFIDTMRSDGIDVRADAYPYGAFSCKIGSSVFDEGCFENWNKGYDSIMLSEAPYKGVLCDAELFKKIRNEYPNMYVIAMTMNEEEIKRSFKNDAIFVASDGGYNNHQGHPRGAGAFARFLGRYCLKEGFLNFFEAVRKMTLDPAERLGLQQRKGVIAEGYDADLVVFEKDKLMDRATFESPQLSPSGVTDVWVNGDRVVGCSRFTDKFAGRFIAANQR